MNCSASGTDLALEPAVFLFHRRGLRVSTIMAIVAITHHDSIERGIAEALGQIDLRSLVKGKLVAVKPNDTYATKDDTSAITQPDTLRAVLREIKKHAPRETVVTGGAGAAETDDVFRVSGMMQVVEEEGAKFFDHNRAPFVPVELPYAPNKDVAGPQKSVMVNPRVLDYETLIALNQLKV